jgi:bacterioferritin
MRCARKVQLGRKIISKASVSRDELIAGLNEELAHEYQAIISYVNYSQVLKGAQYMKTASVLEVHAGEELDHALKVARQIDYLGAMTTVVPKPVQTSESEPWRKHCADADQHQ